tara:strand:- start:389 stop:595 length:207 start_codon:yes stop_codon:yes gene_type:complete
LGFLFAVSKVITVIAIALNKIRCAIVVIPKIHMLVKYIENTTHHIHAKTCIIICLTLVSGIFFRGFLL